MIIPTYTLEDFKKLPLRAIVAFAVRCARRVEQLSILPDDHPEQERCRSAVGEAIQMAEDFARLALHLMRNRSRRHRGEPGHRSRRARARDNAIAAVVQAAYATATALNAVFLGLEPEERHFSGPATRPLAPPD